MLSICQVAEPQAEVIRLPGIKMAHEPPTPTNQAEAAFFMEKGNE